MIKAGMKFRILDSMPLVLSLSDKHALICLPSKSGVPDRNHYLFGYDYAFKHWVFHCFNHFWARAEPVNM